MKTFIFTSTFIIAAVILSCNNETALEKSSLNESELQHEKVQTIEKTSQVNSSISIEVVQFHNEYRCYSCNKVEELTRETLKDYPNIVFKTVNVQDEKNKTLLNEFEAFGSALYLHNPKTGNKKDVTASVFTNTRVKDRFINELRKLIEDFN